MTYALQIDGGVLGLDTAVKAIFKIRRASGIGNFAIIPEYTEIEVDLVLGEGEVFLTPSTVGSIYQCKFIREDDVTIGQFFFEMPSTNVMLSTLKKITAWPDELISNEELNEKIEDHKDDSENPHGVTAEQVGLGSVDNTSDADKPISEQTQAAIDQLRTESEFGDAILNGQVQIERDERTLADNALELLINSLANGATKAYLTYAALDVAKATLPANSFARVTNDPTPANNWLWQWNGTVLTKSDRDDLAVALAAVAQEVADRSALIGIDYTQDGQIALKNALGFVFGLLGVGESVLNGVTLTGGNVTAKSALADRYNLNNGCTLYPANSFFEITNGLGFIIDELPSVSGGGVAPTVFTDLTKPLFSKTLCGWAGEPITIHVPQLLQNRATQATQKYVTATIVSTDTTGAKAFCAESDVTLSVRPDLIGASAELHLRDSRSNTVRTVLPILKCAGVPQGSGQAIKVLMIGDSITDRGGAACVAAQLTAHGYTPEMIGTVLGTSITPSGTGGLLGEGRGGAQFAHYSYIFTSRSAVTVGGEAAYLALPKTDQVNRNPFVRPTVGGDNGSFVYNGHIFDMRFYLNRFSLPDPDVVYINLGTNDILTQTTAGMIANVSASLNIMLRQTRTALPSAKIIVGLPSTAYSADKDAVWSEGYYNAIRTIQTTVDAIADSKTFICAEWAVMPANAGFALSGSTDATSGAINGAWSDDLHPTVGGRAVKYSFAAAHIAAAHLNLI